MRKILIILTLFIGQISYSQTTITKVLDEFDELKVYNGIEVELIKSNEQKAVITGEKAEKVKLKISSKKLKITLKFPEISGDGKAKVQLYYDSAINLVDANEGARITGKVDQFQLEVKSQEKADVKLEIKTKHLKVKASSGGIIELKGSSKNQDVDLDLYGIYQAYDLTVSDLTSIRVGSGAKAEIKAGETLDAKVTFGGSISYKGTPEVFKEKKVAGGIIKQVE